MKVLKAKYTIEVEFRVGGDCRELLTEVEWPAPIVPEGITLVDWNVTGPIENVEPLSEAEADDLWALVGFVEKEKP